MSTDPDPSVLHPFRTWSARLVRVAAAIGACAVVAFLVLRETVLAGGRWLVDLELAGTADRAAQVLSGTEQSTVWHALAFQVLAALLAASALASAAPWLGQRGYRIKALRLCFRGVVSMTWGAFGLYAAGSVVLALALREDAETHATTVGDGWAALVGVLIWPALLGGAAALLYTLGAAGGYVVTPEAVQSLLLNKEKRADDLPPVTKGLTDTNPRRYTICLSGGGVRSASFALGGLQGLEEPLATEPDLAWRAASRVCAVSGGAYMAAAWWMARHAAPDAWSAGSPEEGTFVRRLGYLFQAEPKGVEVRATAPGQPGEPPPERPAGNPLPKNAPGPLVTLGFGLVVNLAVLFGLLWLLARPLGWLASSCWVAPRLQATFEDGGVAGCGFAVTAGRGLDLGRAQWLPPLAFAGLTAFLVAVWVLSGRLRTLPGSSAWLVGLVRRVHQAMRPVVIALAVATAALAVVLLALPALTYYVASLASPVAGTSTSLAWLSGTLSAMSGLGVLAAAGRVLAAPMAKIAPRLGGALLALVATVVGALWAANAAVGGTDDLALTAWLGLAGWAAYLVLNPEWWSPAAFYRGRLRSAYATYRDGDGYVTAYGDGDRPGPNGVPRPEPSMYEWKSVNVPELVLCATASVSDRTVMTHYGIPAYRLALTATDCSLYAPHTDDGVFGTSTCTTKGLEVFNHRWDSPRITTMFGVEASGAALAPAMGRESMGSTDSLLALANLRLGVWLPNPRYVRWLQDVVPTAHRPARWLPYPRLRIGYLLKELLQIHDPEDLYLYTTDGGHFENTGLVDALRGPVPHEVLCLDGSGVAVNRVTSAAEGIGLAHLECGVDVRLDLDALRADPDRPRGKDYAERAVGVGVMVRAPRDGQGTPTVGLLWYAKPVLTADAPPTALAYRERVPTFPADSTIDQFFDTEQFEAYRDLGRAAAAQILQARSHVLVALAAAATLGDLRHHATSTEAHWATREVARLLKQESEFEALRRRLHREELTAVVSGLLTLARQEDASG
jgi:hypothetical protein